MSHREYIESVYGRMGDENVLTLNAVLDEILIEGENYEPIVRETGEPPSVDTKRLATLLNGGRTCPGCHEDSDEALREEYACQYCNQKETP